jgi:hypothetical protein
MAEVEVTLYPNRAARRLKAALDRRDRLVSAGVGEYQRRPRARNRRGKWW